MNCGHKTAKSNRIMSVLAGALLCLGCLIHPATASADPGKHGDVNGDACTTDACNPDNGLCHSLSIPGCTGSP